MGVPVRTAVEAPEGGRAPKERAAAPIISRRQRLSMVRGKWLACAFRRFAAPGAATNLEAWCSKTRTLSRRENDFVYPPPRSET